MSLETHVARLYTTPGLADRIDAALREAGRDPAQLDFDALKPVDEFHTGGLEATSALLDQLEITPEMTVIDIGCGIGGTARHIVHRYGARVRGVDLTETFVEIGRAMNERLGLQDRIDLQQASALALPFDDASTDLAVMFHVGMNLADKAAAFAEIARVLRPGGHFALFDVMRGDTEEALDFPVPWADATEISHVEPPGVYRRAAHAAGLEEVAERDRTEFAEHYFDRVFLHIAAEGMPPLGIHLLMGDTARQKLENYVACLKSRRVAPTEMIFRRT